MDTHPDELRYSFYASVDAHEILTRVKDTELNRSEFISTLIENHGIELLSKLTKKKLEAITKIAEAAKRNLRRR